MGEISQQTVRSKAGRLSIEELCFLRRLAGRCWDFPAGAVVLQSELRSFAGVQQDAAALGHGKFPQLPRGAGAVPARVPAVPAVPMSLPGRGARGGCGAAALRCGAARGIRRAASPGRDSPPEPSCAPGCATTNPSLSPRLSTKQGLKKFCIGASLLGAPSLSQRSVSLSLPSPGSAA